jgi:hypothetical protein
VPERLAADIGLRGLDGALHCFGFVQKPLKVILVDPNGSASDANPGVPQTLALAEGVYGRWSDTQSFRSLPNIH